jgi:hypothetical protein
VGAIPLSTCGKNLDGRRPHEPIGSVIVELAGSFAADADLEAILATVTAPRSA